MVVKFNFLNTRGIFTFNYSENCSPITTTNLREYYELLEQINQYIQRNGRNTESFTILRNILNEILETDIREYTENIYEQGNRREGNRQENNKKKIICRNVHSSIFFTLKYIKTLHAKFLNSEPRINAFIEQIERLRLEPNAALLPELFAQVDNGINILLTNIFPQLCNNLFSFYFDLKTLNNLTMLDDNDLRDRINTLYDETREYKITIIDELDDLEYRSRIRVEDLMHIFMNGVRERRDVPSNLHATSSRETIVRINNADHQIIREEERIRDAQQRINSGHTNGNEREEIRRSRRIIANNNELIQRLHRDYPNVIHDPPTRGPNVPVHLPEGIAFEIHNKFATLPIDSITTAMNKFIHKYEVNKLIAENIDISIEDLINQNLYKPLLIFIEHSNAFNTEEKSAFSTKIDRLKTITNTSENFINNKNLYLLSINFVCRTDDDFIEQYIRIYVDECFNAYPSARGQETTEASKMSCSKGVVERILTTIGSVTQNICLIENEEELAKKCPPELKDLDELFNKKLIDIVQKYAQLYFDDGEKNEEIKDMTSNQVRAHLNEFIKQEYNNFIPSALKKLIKKELDTYEQAGFFEKKSFSGGKRNYKKKRTSKRRARKNKTQKRITRK